MQKTHSRNPRPLPLLKGGYDLPRIESLRLVQKFLLKRVDKPEKGGGGVDVEMGGLPPFYYFAVQFNHIYCGQSKVPFISFGSSVF